MNDIFNKLKKVFHTFENYNCFVCSSSNPIGLKLDIKFSDIHWPEDFILPWVSDIGSSNLSENPELNNLMEEFGVPFFFSKEGNLVELLKPGQILR